MKILSTTTGNDAFTHISEIVAHLPPSLSPHTIITIDTNTDDGAASLFLIYVAKTKNPEEILEASFILKKTQFESKPAQGGRDPQEFLLAPTHP